MVKYPCASSPALLLLALSVSAGAPVCLATGPGSGDEVHVCPCPEHRESEALPMDASAHAVCARALESGGRSDDAFHAWRYALELDPLMEAAHFGVSHILLDRGDFPDAVKAADEGLRAAPKSARLYLVKAFGLEKLGRWRDARRTMAQGVGEVSDLSLLRHCAELEDQYGRTASRSYAALAEALGRSRDNTGEYLAALRRGREVSLRSGDLKDAAWFEGRLKEAGSLESSLLPGGGRVKSGGELLIRGGMKALLRAARGSERTTPERFFGDYCRTILDRIASNGVNAARANEEAIIGHFRRIAALEALGRREGDHFAITVAADDKARRATVEILHLIGWDIHGAGNEVVVETWEKGSAWQNQDTARELGIDQLALQEALQEGRSFRFDIVDEKAPILFDEALWRGQFYPTEDLPGGLAEAVARDPQLAKLYVGLSDLDGDTASLLIETIGLKALAQKYADLLFSYSSSLAVRKGRAVVPGGEAAEEVWERMAGAAPRIPGRFFEGLLGKDEGKLFAFFFTLSELDSRHQRFFTRNVSRTAEFYNLFKGAPDVRGGAGRTWRSTPFIDFFAEVPLDGEGRVRFPGGPEAWMGAEVQAGPRKDAGLRENQPKTASPGMEDRILLRLARTSRTAAGLERSGLESFLAVAHLDAHRSTPLEGDAARILAQQFEENGAAWPYFAILTGLGRDEYARFFMLAGKLDRLDAVELNRVVGQLHSLLKLICMAKQAGRIDERQSTELFALLCDRFIAAASPREFTMASLDLARTLIAKARPADLEGDADRSLEDILVGRAEEVSLDLGGSVYRLDGGAERRVGYRRVLELQRVPSLRNLLELYDTARAVAGAEDGLGERIRFLEEGVAAIPNVGVPASLNLAGKEKDCLQTFQPRRLVEIVGRLRRLSAGPRPDARELDALVKDFLDAMNPQVGLALAGTIYAAHLNPSDLLISEDPLFLRRHQFIDLGTLKRKTGVFTEALLVQRQVEGSYLRGGFADFAAEAGQTALAGLRIPDAKSYPFAATQIGFLRATRWDLLEDDDLKLLGLKIRAAREWIVRAATDPELMSDLADAASGILSLARRSDLMHSLEARDWESVWKDVTLSDLFFLSDEYLGRHRTDPWDSPTMKALRGLVARDDGARLQWMGPVPGPLFNCGHPHLLRLPPYEHFERFLMPERLAVRAAEFKLYIGEYLDRRGIPAGALETIAEPLAMEILREVRLTGLRDWQAMLAAYSGIDDNLIRGALAKR